MVMRDRRLLLAQATGWWVTEQSSSIYVIHAPLLVTPGSFLDDIEQLHLEDERRPRLDDGR